MNLLDIFRKSKKGRTSTVSLGKMWLCAVKVEPWEVKNWYDVAIVEADVTGAYVHSNGEQRIESSIGNPFSKYDTTQMCGPIGHLEYATRLCQWVGFFNEKKDAEDAYRKFVAKFMQQIETATAKLSLSDEAK